jgi:hypothetical protein
MKIYGKRFYTKHLRSKFVSFLGESIISFRSHIYHKICNKIFPEFANKDVNAELKTKKAIYISNVLVTRIFNSVFSSIQLNLCLGTSQKRMNGAYTQNIFQKKREKKEELRILNYMFVIDQIETYVLV